MTLIEQLKEEAHDWRPEVPPVEPPIETRYAFLAAVAEMGYEEEAVSAAGLVRIPLRLIVAGARKLAERKLVDYDGFLSWLATRLGPRRGPRDHTNRVRPPSPLRSRERRGRLPAKLFY